MFGQETIIPDVQENGYEALIHVRAEYKQIPQEDKSSMKKEDVAQLEDGGNHVVKFHSPACVPCKTLEPIFKQMTSEHPEVTFWSVDISDQDGMGVASHYGVRSVPTVLCIADGRVNEILVGSEATREESLEDAILDM